MKPLSPKRKLFAGIALLVCGILWMLLPHFYPMNGLPALRHVIIVFGAINVLLSFPLLTPKRK